MKKYYGTLMLFTIIIIPMILYFNFQKSGADEDQQLKDFIKYLEPKIKPLEKEMSVAYFNAAVSGNEADYKKSADLEIKLSKIYSNKKDFSILKKLKESGKITDELLQRQLNIMYNDFLNKQVDEKKSEMLITLQSQIEQKFSTFRTIAGHDTLTDNDVNQRLKTSTNSSELENVWLSSKKIGKVVAAGVIRIVKLRNEVARELGFKNYHDMELRLDEQDPEEIEKVFDELDNLTADAFKKLKSEINDHLAKRYNISKEELMPWHYQDRFFQEGPKIYNVDPDIYYKGQDIISLTKNYYQGIGLDISPIVAKSDLYEKPGKNQHAFCTDIDREGDVRVLANIKPEHYWMGTLLHEFGHGIYFEKIDRSLPYMLREPAHTFTTEAIAMMFGRFAINPSWLNEMKLISETEKAKIAEASHKSLQLQQLVFSRWAQVMYRFEKGMYENPDQDLNKLWWRLVEKYQLLKCPANRDEPDWASKIHIVTSPCYYHNYLLGEMLASQLYYYITKNVIKSDDFVNQGFVNHPEVGKYLTEKVFMPGRKWYWNDMIKNATGEKLTAKYYALQFVN